MTELVVAKPSSATDTTSDRENPAIVKGGPPGLSACADRWSTPIKINASASAAIPIRLVAIGIACALAGRSIT
ncbi:MAG TPA: hypothetical protein VF991_04215 [Reyranella sp.]